MDAVYPGLHPGLSHCGLAGLWLADAVELLRLVGELHVEVHEVERHGGDVRGQQRRFQLLPEND